MAKYQQIEEILPLCLCVECGESTLKLVSNNKKQWLKYAFDTGEIALHCNQCDTHYPITDDGIPILWTSQIKEVYLKKEEYDIKKNVLGKHAALYSNITSYERISDDYAISWRKEESLGRRIKVGAVRLCRPIITNDNNGQYRYHLDVGCGPGHVLEWLSDTGYLQIGLDISLANLRNARKSTGAFVILGDGTAMPFKSNVFHLVTGAAVLHHIYEWKKAVQESCRICDKVSGGILFDSEPTVDSLNLSLFARLVFDMRWPCYKILSYIDPKKIHFRNISFAKHYYRTAEVHNQPGRGISIVEVSGIFKSVGFAPEIFLSPNDQLQLRQKISWKEAGWKRIVLHLLSGHNPLLAKYGSFTVLAVPAIT